MTVRIPGTGTGRGVGDTIRVYNAAGSQHLPNNAFTKITLFDTHAGPSVDQGSWSEAAYGDLTGGTTFAWDAANDRIEVLRPCIVQPFVNADNTAVDAAVVDPVTGKVDVAQPILCYLVKTSAHTGMNDALFTPATPQINSAFGYGGGNMLLPSFPVQAGEFLTFHIGLFNTPAGIDLIYADLNLRNISPLG